MKLNNDLQVALVVACIQFVNALEFMVIAPIAPYLLQPFRMYPNQIGILTGAYTFCAIFSGLLGFFYLDFFNKKRVLCITLIILGLTNFLSIFCTNLYMIVVIRLVAGFFGGVTISLGMALLISNTSMEQRARAFSIAMMAFPLVSIIGIPSGVWVVEYFSYKVLFTYISVLILVVAIFACYLIPENKIIFNKVEHKRIKLSCHSIFVMTLLGIAQFPIYLLLPSLALIMRYNMHVPSQELPFIFMAGGIASLTITKLSGRLIDKFGVNTPINCGTITFILVLLCSLIFMWLPPIIFMALLMAAVYIRLVPTSLITSTYPEEHQRSGFSALQSALNNIGATVAGFLSSWILVVNTDMTLGNIKILVLIAILSALLLPLGVSYYQKRLKTK